MGLESLPTFIQRWRWHGSQKENLEKLLTRFVTFISFSNVNYKITSLADNEGRVYVSIIITPFQIYREISNYEDEVYTIKNDTSNECFPDLPTFGDIPNNPLVNPVTKFVDKALGLLKPVQVGF